MYMDEFNKKVEKAAKQVLDLAHDIDHDKDIHKYFSELYELDSYTEDEDEYYIDAIDIAINCINDMIIFKK